MASGKTGLLLKMPDTYYLETRSEYTEMLGGDHKASTILFTIGFRANMAVPEREKGEPVPETASFTVNWEHLIGRVLDGMYSSETVLQRLEYLKDQGFIDFDVRTGGHNRTYTLNVAYTNRCVFEGIKFPPPESADYYADRRKGEISSTENRASQHGKPGQLARKTGLLPLCTNTSSNTSLNTVGKIEDVPSEEENPKPPDPIPGAVTSCPILDSSELEDTIEDFVTRKLRIIRQKKCRLKTKDGHYLSTLLHEGEEKYGTAEYRMAFIQWCYSDSQYLKENKYPLRHFLKHVEEHIPDSVEVYRAGAPAAPPAPVSPRREQTPAPPVLARPSASDYVATWNRIATSKPYEYTPPPALNFYEDPGITMELWEKACVVAHRIIQEKGDAASWLDLEWLLVINPKKTVKRINWRRLASGEYNHMAVGDKQYERSTHDSKVTESGTKLLMEMFGNGRERRS